MASGPRALPKSFQIGIFSTGPHLAPKHKGSLMAPPRTSPPYHNPTRGVNNPTRGISLGNEPPITSREPHANPTHVGNLNPPHPPLHGSGGHQDDLLRSLGLTVSSMSSSWRPIGTDNSGGETCSFEEAVALARGGHAVAGRVRRDMVVLDLDCQSDLDVDLDRALDEAGRAILAGRVVRDGIATPIGAEGRDSLRRVRMYELAAELISRGRRPVIVRSGRTGNRHLLVRIPDYAERGHVVDSAKVVGVDVRQGNALVRPPGWPHRQGLPVSVASIGSTTYGPVDGSTPGAWWRAVEALEAPTKDADLVSRDGSSRLPTALWQLIRYGDRDGRYTRSGATDRSALTLAICNMSVSAGIHDSRLWNLLIDPRNVGGEGLRSRIDSRGVVGRGSARAWFEGVCNKARDGRPRGPWKPRDVYINERLNEISALASAVSMSGASGSSDRVALAACLRMAHSWNALTIPVSVRGLAMEAGLSEKTAQRALKRLRAAGWLQLCRTSRQERSAVYRLVVPTELRSELTANTELPFSTEPALTESSQTGVAMSDAHEYPSSIPTGGRRTVVLVRETSPGGVDLAAVLELSGHDAFHRYALGKGALETWARLGAVGISVTDLAHSSGKHAATIRRHLGHLLAAGLAEKGSAGWCRAVVVDVSARLEEVAEDAGTAGLGARRRARFDAERRAYRQYLEEVVAAAIGQPLFSEPQRRGSTARTHGAHQHRGPPAAA